MLHTYSLPNFLANVIATPILWFCMTLVAKTPDGYAGLGLYNAAYQWHGPLVFLPMILMTTSVPVLVQEWEGGRLGSFRKVVLSVFSLTLALTVIPVVLLSALGQEVMALYGPDFIEGWELLVLFLVAAPFHAVSNIAASTLLAVNRAWLVLFANILWGIVLLSGTVVSLEEDGVTGLARSFLAAYVVQGLLMVALVYLRSFRQAKTWTARAAGETEE